MALRTLSASPADSLVDSLRDTAPGGGLLGVLGGRDPEKTLGRKHVLDTRRSGGLPVSPSTDLCTFLTENAPKIGRETFL